MNGDLWQLNNHNHSSLSFVANIVKLLHEDAKNESKEIRTYIHDLIKRANRINIQLETSGMASSTDNTTVQLPTWNTSSNHRTKVTTNG